MRVRIQLAAPPIVRPPIRKVGWPTPTGTHCPALPQLPIPGARAMSLPIALIRLSFYICDFFFYFFYLFQFFFYFFYFFYFFFYFFYSF